MIQKFKVVRIYYISFCIRMFLVFFQALAKYNTQNLQSNLESRFYGLYVTQIKVNICVTLVRGSRSLKIRVFFQLIFCLFSVLPCLRFFPLYSMRCEYLRSRMFAHVFVCKQGVYTTCFLAYLMLLMSTDSFMNYDFLSPGQTFTFT